ncbi:MAG: hypothetical protein FP831_07535, partial [Anaerolineae bacterium]|nr:hypothetical protein [Anaerolineae bacterium]
MSAPRFARVAVNITQLTGLFDYAIPEEWQDQVKPGSLVTIPFGRQLTQGIVLMLTDDPAVPNPKVLDSLVEKEAVVTPQQIKLAQWMADENLSSLSACLELMLPPGLSQHADILVHLVEIPQDVEL